MAEPIKSIFHAQNRLNRADFLKLVKRGDLVELWFDIARKSWKTMGIFLYREKEPDYDDGIMPHYGSSFCFIASKDGIERIEEVHIFWGQIHSTMKRAKG